MLGLLKARWIPFAGVGAVCFFVGWQTSSWKSSGAIGRLETKLEAKDKAAAEAAQVAAERARDLAATRQALADAVAREAQLRRQKREVVEKVVETEVIKYVETPNATECGLSADGVRIHDTAASGVLDPEPPTGTDGAAGLIENAEVIRTVIENYATCRANADRLMGLQDYVKGLGDAE